MPHLSLCIQKQLSSHRAKTALVHPRRTIGVVVPGTVVPIADRTGVVQLAPHRKVANAVIEVAGDILGVQTLGTHLPIGVSHLISGQVAGPIPVTLVAGPDRGYLDRPCELKRSQPRGAIARSTQRLDQFGQFAQR